MNTAKFPRAAVNGAPEPETSGVLALAARPSEPPFEPAKALTKTLFYASPAAPPPPGSSAPATAPGAESTHFFSVEELLGRRAPEPAPALPEVSSMDGGSAKEPSGFAALRATSPARKAILVLLPLLIGLILVRPMLRERFAVVSARAVPSAPMQVSPSSVPAPSPEPEPSAPLASPVTKISLPNGVTLARAAADSVAAGDFRRALTLYRGLAAREPNNPAHARAVSILEQRARRAAP